MNQMYFRIEEYEQALREFEEQRPPNSASSADPHYKSKFDDKKEEVNTYLNWWFL